MKVYDPDLLDRGAAPIRLPQSIVWLLGFASVVTVGLAAIGGHHVARYFSVDSFAVTGALSLALAFALAFAWWPGTTVSAALRVAVLLPVLHVAAIVAGWWIWRSLQPGEASVYVADEAPLARLLPLGLVVAVASVAMLALARVIAWRRRGEWLHAFVMLALVDLLLTGLAAPIACRLAVVGQEDAWMRTREVRDALHAWPLVLGIPLALATMFTTLAIREPELVQRHRRALSAAVKTAIGVACVMTLSPWSSSPQLYANYAHVLLALVVVAAGALALLAAATVSRALAWRRALAGNPLRGTIVREGGSDGSVACLEITGWLRGPRLRTRAFEVVTRAGTVAIPRGVAVVTGVPGASTRLIASEAVCVLREGDRVVLAGLVEPPADHPFRAQATLLPGPNITIGRDGEPPAGLVDAALVLWRPCVAYLVTMLAVALPALAAALAAT